MKLIPLTRGYQAMVDDEDYERVMMRRWTTCEGKYTVYALHHFNSKATGRGCISLHRFVMNAPGEITVDHKDRNGLNCQKYNLRLATRTQQAANRVLPRTFKYKGVYNYQRVTKRNNRWQAMIRIDGKLLHLGMFATDVEAAIAYDKAAKEAWGKFAVVNFP